MATDLPAPKPTRLGFLRLSAINAFWFGNGAHWQPIFNPLIPVGAMLIVGDKSSPLLIGRVTAAGGVFALLVPLFVGYLSDRTRTRWGRRRPWMVGGVLVNLLGLYLVGVAFTPVALILSYIVLQASNNVAGAAYAGIIPDVVAEEDRGRASGLLGVMNGLGTVVGVAGVSIILAILHDSRAGLLVSYTYIAVVLTATLIITCLGTPERRLPPRVRQPIHIRTRDILCGVALAVAVTSIILLITTDFSPIWLGMTLLSTGATVGLAWTVPAVREAIQPLRNRDFFWVFATRGLTQMGIFTILPFMTNYFADVVHAKDPGAASGFWLLAVIAGGIIPAIICGHLSDRTGRRKIFVYLSAGMQAVIVGVLLFGLVSSLFALYVLGVLYGIGYGTYYAVDWALACDVLPQGSAGAGKDMALYHIAFTLPQALVPAILGGIIYHLNLTGGHVLGLATGNLLGYRFVFFAAAIWFVLGTVMVSKIKSVR
jgi:MFS family permease